MKLALFKPFDIAKWLILGLNAFLAGEMNGAYGNGISNKFNRNDYPALDNIHDIPNIIRDWAISHPGWMMVIIIGIVFVIGLIVLFTWLSSRGAFMFLDNVVWDKAEVSKPWHEYASEAHSLFLWRMGFGLVCFAVIGGFIGIILVKALPYWDFTSFNELPWGSIASFALLFLLLVTFIGYISMFLNNFVIPIMYKDRLTVLPAWSKFMSLFSDYPAPFIMFGALLTIFYIAIGILIVLVSVLTCCIGLILLSLPYINSVILLPISYTYRAYGVLFLQQFGTEFELFPRPTVVKPEIIN
jgi:hypothetical protein